MGKITVVDIVLRLLGAVIVGFAVGAQRARTSHPAEQDSGGTGAA